MNAKQRRNVRRFCDKMRYLIVTCKGVSVAIVGLTYNHAVSVWVRKSLWNRYYAVRSYAALKGKK